MNQIKGIRIHIILQKHDCSMSPHRTVLFINLPPSPLLHRHQLEYHQLQHSNRPCNFHFQYLYESTHINKCRKQKQHIVYQDVKHRGVKIHKNEIQTGTINVSASGDTFGKVRGETINKLI